MTGGACGTSLPVQSDIVIGAESFSISASELTPEGYSYSICYSCDIQPLGGLPILTFIKDLITIEAYPLDCMKENFTL